MKWTFNPFTGNLDALNDLAVSITTAELQTAITNSTLVAGQWYLITDTGEIVQATSTNTIHSVVPYTGATADVDLGNHTLTCGGTASGMSTIEGGLTVNDGGGGTANDDFRVETDNVAEAVLVDASADTVKIGTDLILSDVPADTDNTVLILNSSNKVTSDEIDSRVWGSTLVDGSGTDTYISYWSDSNTITGSSNFTIGSNKLTLTNNALLCTGTTGDTPVTGAGTRMMWIPAKAAFMAGEVTSTQWDSPGSYSVAFGYNNRASGGYTFAVGYSVQATQTGSTAFGYGTTASGQYSLTAGYYCTASGTYAFSTGYQNVASGEGSVCMGYDCDATQNYAFAGGYQSQATAIYAFAFGYKCTASASYSFASGNTAQASGATSMAVGSQSTASGNAAVCLGAGTAYADYSFCTGYSNRANEYASSAFGKTSYSNSYAALALSSGKFSSVQDNGKCQSKQMVVYGEMAAFEEVTLSASGYYYKTEDDVSAVIKVLICCRADDETSAFFEYNVLVSNSSGTLSILHTSVVDSADDDAIIDEINFSGSDENFLITLVSNYDDDIGVVAHILGVENGYAAAVATS